MSIRSPPNWRASTRGISKTKRLQRGWHESIECKWQTQVV
jgi:hypothetical protein